MYKKSMCIIIAIFICINTATTQLCHLKQIVVCVLIQNVIKLMIKISKMYFFDIKCEWVVAHDIMIPMLVILQLSLSMTSNMADVCLSPESQGTDSN